MWLRLSMFGYAVEALCARNSSVECLYTCVRQPCILVTLYQKVGYGASYKIGLPVAVLQRFRKTA